MNTTGDVTEPDATEVQTILREFKVLDPTRECDDAPCGAAESERLLAIAVDPESAAKFVKRLFPDGCSTDSRFFNTLNELRRWTGCDRKADEAIGRVWSASLQTSSPEDKQRLLTTLITPGDHDFYESVQSLAPVFADHEFPPEFTANFLATLLRLLENDLACGIGESSRKLITKHPLNAVATVRACLKDRDDYRSRLATYFLGILRAQTLDAAVASALESIENDLGASDEFDVRSIFNWSWITTAHESGITQDALETLVQRAASDDPRDADDILAVVGRICLSRRISIDVFDFAVRWVGSNLALLRTSQTRCHVLDAAANLIAGQCVAEKPLLECAEWLVDVAPVPSDEIRTWSILERGLVNVLKNDRTQFCSVFKRLAEHNAGDMHEIMQQPQQFRRLPNELRKTEAAGLIGELCVSDDMHCRRLGLYLFDELEIDKIPEDVFPAENNNAVRLLFYEVQRTIVQPGSLARLFVSMLPVIDRTDEQFQSEFVDELRLQIRNFGGGCRTELERLAGSEQLVKVALDKVAEECSALQRAHDAGLNQMEVQGHHRAAVLHRRRMSRDMKRGIASQSIILSACKNVDQVYGTSTGTFIDGGLRESSPLVPFSSNVELPFVDFRDPEEMAMRRIHASKSIDSLSGQEEIDD